MLPTDAAHNIKVPTDATIAELMISIKVRLLLHVF